MKEIFKIKQLMNRIYMIRNFNVSMFLIIGDEKAVLFDTGYGFSNVGETIRKITDKPVEVVISHGHFDHGGGNWEFEEVYIHPADWNVMERHSSRTYREIGLKTAELLNKIPFWRILPPDFDNEIYLNRSQGIFKAIKEGDVFKLGGMELQVIELPGHTPGSIGLYCPEKKLIFVSDAVNAFLFLFLEESMDLETYKNTLYKLKAMDFKYMIQAHSTKIFPKTVLDSYIEVAENPDWKNGKVRKNDLLSGDKVVKTVRCANNPKNKSKIVIEKSRL